MTWKDDFRESLISFLVRNGTPVSLKDRTYGWMDYEWQYLNDHLTICGTDITRSSWEDSEWSEFCGTFAEPPFEQRRGVDAVVYCNCGQISGRRWRYTGSYGELLKGITS